MYKVVVNSVTFGRRTFKKGTILTKNDIPLDLLKSLEKAGKVEVKKESK
jgi:hypothetical protein